MKLCAQRRIICSALLLWATSLGASESEAELRAHGEYVLRISGCVHCHTADGGEELAGGRALPTPFGTFYAPNITPHERAGIGAWSEAEFRRALHEGVAPDGGSYFPAFPYTSYTRMRSEDVRALYAYLMSLPASAQPNRAHELPWYLRWRFAARVWQWLFFEPGEFQDRPERSASWNRGAYIAQALGHCGECHTPRNVFGALRTELAYAGTDDGPDGEKVPNITPHERRGIGDWSPEDLNHFLASGELPDGEYATGSMEPVTEGLIALTPQDRDALIEYLRALPALVHPGDG